jgi:chemotaxis protein MotB
MNKLSVLLLLAGFTVSCVPPTRFKALQSESVTCQEERERLKAENENISVENREMKSKLAMAEKSLAQAGRDTVKWKNEVTRLSGQNIQLNKDYSDLQEAQQALLKGSAVEIRQLMDELNQRNARLTELEKVLKNQESVLTTLKKKVSDALLGFENQGLTVTQKNGKVYVSLDEKLLFKSGSTVVDPKGVSALKNLSKVLEQNPDINVMIEGHTDDVPVISGSQYKDNWDLSVLRATSIVRILLGDSSINPQRLTTAGRSQYLPVDPEKTAEARQKNRRTEIILSPKLDELYKIIDK